MTDGFTDEPTNGKAPGLDAGVDALGGGYDLDGNGVAFDDFYGTLSNNLAFDHTLFAGCNIRPASTLDYINGKDSRYANTEFQELGQGEVLNLGAETGGMTHMHNITMSGCENGIINVRNAIVHGLTVDGQATVQVSSGQLNGFQMTENSNVILRTEGGTLNRIDFKGANISGNSDFSNAVVRDGEISNCDISNVSFNRADISGVHISGGTISNCSFDGAMFRNMSINTDTRGMDVNNATFHNVNVYDPTLNQYRRVDNGEQFSAIQRSYGTMEQAVQAAGALANATQPLCEAEQASAPTMANLGAAMNQFGDNAARENLNAQTLTTPEALAARVAKIMDRDLGIS